MKRTLAALLTAAALTVLTTGPASATFAAAPEVAFTGHLYSVGRNLNYCGVGHSQIGNAGADAGKGVAFTRPALFYGVCATNTVTTGWRDWLGVQVSMIRNGRVCGQTIIYRNQQETYIMGITAQPCQNNTAIEQWQTAGSHYIYDSSTGAVRTGMTLSPIRYY
jgi:hypothetical protein